MSTRSVKILVLGFLVGFLNVVSKDSVAQLTPVEQGDSLMLTSRIKGPLEFQGYSMELSRKLKGTVVTLFESPDGSHENLTEVFKTITPGSGLFEFKLEINRFYVLSVEKTGYTTKKIDFDTDVSMARAVHTSVPKFKFEVILDKDKDGLDYTGSVASVFYQIKTNTFNYELDYSKEELEDEEREYRQRLEKQRLAELAFQKKIQLEQAAQLLLQKENLTAQEIIRAAITVGDGNKEKTVEGFKKVFPKVDTLRDKKAVVMYDQLLQEREMVKGVTAELNLGAIFESAKALEEDVVIKAKEQREQEVAILRGEKEAAEQKTKEVLAIQQKSAELEVKEQLAAAIAAEEARKKKEEQEIRDKIYYAIFDSEGSSSAIDNLMKSFPKGSRYKEERATAIYDEYEKARLTGVTLSKMDFNRLYAAADSAEQKAIREEINADNARQNAKMKAFQNKVEERKREEQRIIIRKIESGLETAPPGREEQITVFKNSLPKNEAFLEQKAEAMYEHYVEQKKALRQIESELRTVPLDSSSQMAVFLKALPASTPDRQSVAKRMYQNYVASRPESGGFGSVSMDQATLFEVAEQAAQKAERTEKEENAKAKRGEQEAIEAERERVRSEKRRLASESEKQVKELHQAEMARARNKKEQDLAAAIKQSAGDRDRAVEEIVRVLPKTDDPELRREQAEAVYDTYLKESRALRESGNTEGKVDFDKLFKAADQVTLAKLQEKFEETQANEQAQIMAYEEKRTEQALALAQKQQDRAEREVSSAELAYEKTRHRTEAVREERLAEEKRQQTEAAKRASMEQARREAQENTRREEELALLEKEREARLAKERRQEEALAAKRAAEERRLKELADKEAREQLALLKKQQRIAEEEERRIQEQEEKKRRADQLAAQQREADRLKQEQRRLAEAEAARKRQELADVKAAEEERKRLAALEQQRIKDEEARVREEQRQKELAEKAEQEAILAAAKEKERLQKLEEKRLEELARKEAAEKARLKKEEFDRYVTQGDGAMERKDYKNATDKYTLALERFPEDRKVADKLATAAAELQRAEEEIAAQKDLDNRYDRLMREGDSELALTNFDAATAKFKAASTLKPNEQTPKQKLRSIERTLERLAAEEKQRQVEERRFILLLQDGDIAMKAGKLEEAKAKFQEANGVRPNAQEPLDRLEQVRQLEEQQALADAAELERQRIAQRELERKQAEERRRKEEALQRYLAEQERINAGKDQVGQAKEQQQLTAEQQRQQQYDRLQQSLKQMDLDEDEQRQAFLSELARIYPEGVTKETIEGSNYFLVRHVINESNVVTIYEKKTWDWGGVYHFKNTDIDLTPALYELEIKKYTDQ